MNTLSTVRVDLGERSYDIRIGRDRLDEVAASLAGRFAGRPAVIVTNPEIGAAWGGRLESLLNAAGLACRSLLIPEGEEHKNLATVSSIYDFLIGGKYTRQTVIIALGGGVIGDTAGFAADSFLRGVSFVQMPTSLLAMVDSSVGGKTGVNHPLGKNLIGAFKQPDLVEIDLDFLETLPVEEFRSGMAEVVKYGMIADAEFFGFIESVADSPERIAPEAIERMVTRSCEIKADVVAQDETESGIRAHLNFGHTYAHAVENLTNYGTVRHGEAVAMGMMSACRLGEIVGGFPANETARLGRLLDRLGLPTRLPRFDAEAYLGVMRSDKKVVGDKLRFVVPEAVGRVAVRGDIPARAVIESLEKSWR